VPPAGRAEAGPPSRRPRSQQAQLPTSSLPAPWGATLAKLAAAGVEPAFRAVTAARCRIVAASAGAPARRGTWLPGRASAPGGRVDVLRPSGGGHADPPVSPSIRNKSISASWATGASPSASRSRSSWAIVASWATGCSSVASAGTSVAASSPEPETTTATPKARSAAAATPSRTHATTRIRGPSSGCSVWSVGVSGAGCSSSGRGIVRTMVRPPTPPLRDRARRRTRRAPGGRLPPWAP
jgi:hypothetical protein